MTPEEGYQEALRRIEVVRNTGDISLSLSELHLTVIPVELTTCCDLKVLIMTDNHISQIENLPAGLVTLHLMDNQIRRLENLPESLQILNLGNNKILKIEKLPNKVKSLALSYNCISKLENLPASIQELTLNANRITQLENLPEGLQRLDLSRNQISKIENLPAGLLTLDLNRNQIIKLENLPDKLQTLDLWLNQISKLENLPKSLQMLRLWGNPTKNIPVELRGDSWSADCLSNVRAWFADLEKGVERNTMIKFMVSGNSNVGKSSLIEALRTGKSQPGHDSTHGIRIKPLPLTDGLGEVEGIAFDFGGQEIYHGTHQLFLRSRAVQLVVFDAETETKAIAPDRRGKLEEINRNKTLSNWIHDLRRLSSNSAFVLIQNKIELSASLPSVTQTIINQLETDQAIWTSRVSAWTGRYIAALRGTLVEAAQSLPEYGMLMPKSWLAVRDYFLENSQKPVAERKRVVTRSFFDQLCTNHSVFPGSDTALLRYLHNTGVIYYDETYLKDIIIADQQWAIEAIYEVLDRQGRLYDELANESYGKKRLKYLFGYFNQAYTADERKLFVAMMESCGLCFPLREQDYDQVKEDTYYLFPQFLPDTRPDGVTYFLSHRKDHTVFTQHVGFLPYYHIQQLIARWGIKTDIRNIWRTGFLVALPNEGQFVLEADLTLNTLTLTAERTILTETVDRLRQELGYQDSQWQLNGEGPIHIHEKGAVNQAFQPVIERLPVVVQPKIKKVVVSFAKEDLRYVDLLRKKLAARNTIDLWYDRHINGWSDWDSQIKDHFADYDGYIIFLSDTYMDAETKTYIHEKEIPLMCQRFASGQAYVAVINVTSYNTQHTDLAPFLSFRKAALMPDPEQQPAEASQFLEAFINEKLFGDFLKPNI